MTDKLTINRLLETGKHIVARLNEIKNNWNANFDHFCKWVSHLSGQPIAFNVALIVIVFWVLSGPLFGFSDTWQLIINTGTTIITFLMVFIIQHTQNRESSAMHVKLDELIHAQAGARDDLLDLEEMEEQELKLLHEHYVSLARNARAEMAKRPGYDELKQSLVNEAKTVMDLLDNPDYDDAD